MADQVAPCAWCGQAITTSVRDAVVRINLERHGFTCLDADGRIVHQCESVREPEEPVDE